MCEPIEWLGAWVRKQGFLRWVLLWDCSSVHRKASLLGSVPLIWSATCSSRRRDPTASDAQHQTAGHAILCRVRVPERCGARPAPQHREASHGALGSAPRLAARATREHLNGTLFDETKVEQEEPPEEADLILLDDDDDEDAEDPESTEPAVAEASEPFPTVAAEVARADRFLYLRCAYGKHPPKP